MGIELVDVNHLALKLQSLSQTRFDAVILKNMTQIFQRGKADGGTPVDTGQLVGSLSQSGDEVGYTKSYAAHVEYGHRTKSGGYVPGQRFLQKNVQAQEVIYAQDLLKQVRRF